MIWEGWVSFGLFSVDFFHIGLIYLDKLLHFHPTKEEQENGTAHTCNLHCIPISSTFKAEGGA